MDEAVPVVTKIWAVPPAVSSAAGTVTFMVVLALALPAKVVVGDPDGGIQVAMVPPPRTNPVPVIVTA